MGKKIVDGIDNMYDAAKAADRADDIADGVNTIGKIDDAVDIAKLTVKTSVFDNAEAISKKYPMGQYGHFGQKGKNTRIIKTSDPIATSTEFYEIIKKGGIEVPLPNGKGVMTEFEDGSRVIYRITTSTPDSPAIKIQLEISGPIADQKIHFIRE